MERTNQSASASSIIISAIFLGAVVLFASWASARIVDYFAADVAPRWMSVFVNYCIMLATSLILVLASSRGDPTSFGFRIPDVVPYRQIVAPSIILGVCATVAGLLTGTGGPRVLQGLGFWQIVLLIWLFASFSEEILTRGFVQSYLDPLAHRGFTAFRIRFTLPVMLSALFFAAMHLVLLRSGTALVSVYIIVVFTFFLGLLAAYHREKSNSIVPPIVAHISFNVGGVIGGILFVLAQVAFFGRTASEVSRMLGG